MAEGERAVTEDNTGAHRVEDSSRKICVSLHCDRDSLIRRKVHRSCHVRLPFILLQTNTLYYETKSWLSRHDIKGTNFAFVLTISLSSPILIPLFVMYVLIQDMYICYFFTCIYFTYAYFALLS